MKTSSTFELTTLANGRLIRREILGAPRRFLGKCRCKRVLSALVTEIVDVGGGSYGLTDSAAIAYSNGILDFPCNACGATSHVRAVLGKISHRHVCNAKCLASTSGTASAPAAGGTTGELRGVRKEHRRKENVLTFLLGDV